MEKSSRRIPDWRKTTAVKEQNQTSGIKRTIITSLGIAAFAALVYGLARRWKLRSEKKPAQLIRFEPSERGLSEAEAAERRTDERVQARRMAESQARRERRRRNIFSIFNLTIIVLAFSQYFLNELWGAVVTLATLVLNISVNIFQEERATRQVSKLSDKARPLATVIREGQLKSIDQDEVVVGDVLVAGRGDEILADGVLLESANLTIDESVLEEHNRIVARQPGEALHAETFCTSGWAVYRVDRIHIESSEPGDPNAAASSGQTPTPLQHIVERVLYVLLAIAGVFYLTLLLEVIRAEIIPPENLPVYRDVLSVIFSLAPGGLFFMIVINYAVGSADIARSDALVRKSQVIESLAQVSSICLIRRGGVTGVDVKLEMLPSPATDTTRLSESRARQVLGNYVHSTQGDRFPLTILKAVLEGEKRSIAQQTRYLSIYGWEGATFTSTDMPGCYVIGDPEVLKPNLLEPDSAEHRKTESAPEGQSLEGIGARLRKWLRREAPSSPQATEVLPHESKPASAENSDPDSGATVQDKRAGGFLQRVRTRLAVLTRRRDAGKAQDGQLTDAQQPNEILRLLFAYSPIPQPVYDANNQPSCPRDLVPVCYILFNEQIRPEVLKAVQTFLDAGVSIKVLAEEDPMRALAIAQQLGIIGGEDDQVPVATSEEISQWTPDQIRNAAREKSIFAMLDSGQMIRILEALQVQGEYVGVVGSSIADLHIMRQANLSITNQGSSPTVLDQADIILLKNSPNALPEVLQKGQRIVNGLMNVLKLNLTQIFYTLILLVAMFISGGRIFYYQPAQGGAIGIFTVVIPSIVLSLWASTVPVDRTNMPGQLAYFIAPAATTIALTVLLIHSVFSPTTFGVSYSQQIVTHALVLMGLCLVILVQPPVRFLAGGDQYSGDWRPTYVAAALFLLFQLATRIPLAQTSFRIAPLASVQDYLFVWGISLVWATMMLGIWRLRWLKRDLWWSSRRQSASPN